MAMNVAAAGAFRPEMVMPPGWVWIDLDHTIESQVRAVFAEAWNSGPRDSIGPWVRQREQAMLGMLRQARDAGGFAIVMPLGTPWQVPVSLSIALTLVQPDAGHAVELPPGDDASLLVTAGGDARIEVRDSWVHLALASETPREPEALRTLEATWVTPQGTGYLLATSTISGTPVVEFVPVMDALTELVATMFTSLRWTPCELPSQEGADT